MYTAKITGKSVDKQTRQVFIDVAYHKDAGAVPAATEKITVSLGTALEDIKRAIKTSIIRLEANDTNFDLITIGDVDLTGVRDVTTTAEKEKDAWFRDFDRLERVSKLNALGGMPAAWQTDLDALKAKVQANAKKAYIADM